MGVEECKENFTYDIVIVGDTASAIGAAITASKEGKSVCLISRVTKLESMGGMITNGLVYSDIGLPSGETVNGYVKKEYQRLPNFQIPHLEGESLASGLYDEYTQHQYRETNDYRRYTPKIARDYFSDKLKNSETIKYMLGYVVNQNDNKITDTIITDIKIYKLNETNGNLTNQKTIKGKFFIDATDTADLAFLSNVQFKPFREAPPKINGGFDEGFAGELYWNPTRLEFIYNNNYRTPKLMESKGDDKLQAYSYFLAIKRTSSIEKIEEIDIWKKEIDIREKINEEASKINEEASKIEDSYFNNFDNTKTVTDNDKFESSIKGTYEVNVHPKGSDLQEKNYNYHSSSWSERIKKENLYKIRALYFLQYWQEKGEKISLETDWYSNGMPDSMYIRESRRIEGLETFSEKDATPYNLYNFRKNQEEGKGFKLEFREYEVDGKKVLFNEYNKHKEKRSIGLSTYPMDSHATQAHPNYNHSLKKTADENYHAGEGEFYLQGFSAVGIIPIGVIIPNNGAKNLLVTQAVSASHVGYGTLRMEPNRMGMGQAAAVIASLMIKNNNLNTKNFSESDTLIAEMQRILKDDYKIKTEIDNNMKVLYYDYNDLNKDEWYYEFILEAVAKKILTNYEKFNPGKNMTRAEFLKISILSYIYKDDLDENYILNIYKNISQDDIPFDDMNKDDWFVPYVLYAIDNNFINKENSSFNPNDNIDRAQASQIIFNILNKSNDLQCDLNKDIFTDVKYNDKQWYFDPICILKQKNIINGYPDNTFLPAKNINRAEAIKIVIGAFNKKEEN